MPHYRYSAYDVSGKRVHGSMAAASEFALSRQLERGGLTLIDVHRPRRIAFPSLLDGLIWLEAGLESLIRAIVPKRWTERKEYNPYRQNQVYRVDSMPAPMKRPEDKTKK